MKNVERILFLINSAIGLSITIEDVTNVVGLVILIFQAFLLIINMIAKIKEKWKRGESIEEDVKQGIKDLEQLKGDKDGKNSK